MSILPGGGSPQRCQPGGLTPGNPGCARAGNPLNVMTGNKYQREADVPALPGVLGLELVRHYNSDFSGSSSPVGRGWRLGYDGWLYFVSAAGSPLQPRQVGPEDRILHRAGDGSQTLLHHLHSEADGRSTWASAAGTVQLGIDPANGQTPYVLRDGSGLQHHFDARGRQVRIQAATGHAVQIELGGQRQLTLVQGAGCGSCGPVNVRYGHDSLGRQVSVTELSPVRVDADGQVQGTAQPLSSRHDTLDPQGRVLRTERIRYQGGREVGTDRIEERSYADARWPHLPTLIARPSVVAGQEHRIELSYNAAGQITEVKESGFSPLDGAGQMNATAITRSSTYRYEIIGGHSVLVQADGPLPNGPQNDSTDSDITRYQWDESGHRLLAITHPMGLTERFEHEASGDNPSARVTARTDVLGVRTELGWAAHAMRVSQVRRAGVQVDIGHDSRGRVSRYRRNDGAQISVAYDEASGTIRYTLPDGEVREIRHDSEGRPTASQWQDGQGQVLVGQQQIEYGAQDEQGLREVRIQEPTGVQTTLRWDPLGAQREAQRGQGEGRLEQTERFDAAQHLLQVQRNEATTRLQRDQRDASASLELPHGAMHRQWKDDFGRTVRIEHPDSGTHRAAYDEADRQTARWDSSRHSSARYGALGRLVQLRHANSDGQNVQSASAVVKAIVEAEEETNWHYQGALLVRQTSSQQDKHFGYNANGQLIEERLSLRRQSQDTHTTEWLPELITRYQRDGFGRIARIHLPEGAVLSQRYNTQGRIEAVNLQEPASHWWEQIIRWVWAEQGTQELITEIEHSTSRGLRGYQHANGAQVSSTHDQAGRLTRWSDGPFRTELGFNQHAQLSTLKLEAPEALQRPGLTQAAALALQGREQQLRYDPFGRLRQVQEGPLTQGFDYDRNGNRIAQTPADAAGQLSFELAPQSDRLLSVQDNQDQTQKRYQYNSAGEPVRIEIDTHTRTLHYNALGQIGAIEQNGQLLARYAYNVARQRVAKTVGAESEQSATTTYYTWHRGLLDAELDEHGRVQRRYIYLNLRPVALLEYGYAQDKKATQPQSTRRFAIHGDHLGTPQAITDDTQRVVWLARYDAFGRATAQGLPRSQITAHNGSNSGNWIGTAHASTPDKPFEFHLRFAGQYEDTETSWHYNWHRYCEPETGRYLTPDPIGIRGGDNAYGYVEGDPLGAVDPWGLAACYVLFPDYPIEYSDGQTTTWLGGHAGVLTYDRAGNTRYYEYGRYSPNSRGIIGHRLSADEGNVRRIPVPDLSITEDGNPSEISWDRLRQALSLNVGRETRVEMTCHEDANEDRVHEYVMSFANNTQRPAYSWVPFRSNHCRTFANEAVNAGR